MSLVAVKSTQKRRGYIIIFSTTFCYLPSVTEYVLTKNAPGGDLIRVNLIRFPGSIPGGRWMRTS